ncbi:MAG TPA: hypothetical protein VGV67_01935 [Solirubrobacteraceae bacterium]|nr:hypothetical protein [Solirubrobacteraceae bacterium]
MRTAVQEVALRRDDALVQSETTVAAPHPHVLVLSTAVPDIGLTVITTYTGADDVATVAVDLVLGVRPRASNLPRRLRRESVPVTHAREQCLLDHARQVLEVLNASGASRWTIDVSDDAVAQASSV